MSDNPFAAPLAAMDAAAPLPAEHGEWWIDGQHLLCTDGAVLPAISVRSGTSEDLITVRRKLSHVPWPVYLLLLLNVIILVIVALCVRRKAVVTYAMTAEEKRGEGRAKAAACLLGIGGVLIIITGGVNNVPAAMVPGIGMLIGAAVALQRSQPFTVVRIEKDGVVRLKLRPSALEAFAARLGDRSGRPVVSAAAPAATPRG